MTFKALLATRQNDRFSVDLVELDDADLMEGDVTIDVEYSTVNYKDGLALANRFGIIQRFPLIPGADLAGVVSASNHRDFAPGDKVVVNCWGLGQIHHGGFTQRNRVPGEWVVKLPEVFSTRDAMAIGTAGYTAMLAVQALEHGGLTPQSGDILVTGANGGAGSIAIALLARLGYRVIASTGRPEEADYLRGLGAAEIIDRHTLSEPGKPIARERWAGVIDTVGSHTLANVLAQTAYRGVVAAFGMVQGHDLPASVLPFILRNVTLAGIDAVNAPQAVRLAAWARLARDLDPARLAATTQLIGLSDVPEVAQRILQGQVRGRTVVDVNT
ncbi:TPA: oxidoreductase [Pseudomonas aeruginosa]|nr:oxidoreductase [Pseudomonas aeruginosa]